MTAGRHIPALDGIRGLAAILVVLSHFPTFALPVIVNHHVGDYGVLLFFTLSGFLMGHLYLPRIPDRMVLAYYAAARIARIVPLYACISLLSFAIYRFYPDFIYPIGLVELVRQVSFTSSVSVFWSIGPEFQFYFLFPLFWGATYARKAIRGWLYLAIGGGIAICYAASPWLPGFSAFAKMHIFMAGILCAMLVRRLTPAQMDRLLIPLALFSLLFLALLAYPPAPMTDWIFPSTRHDPKHLVYYGDPLKLGASILIILSATIPHPINDHIWGNRVMRLLGAYSFSLYLLHMPLFQLARLTGMAFGLTVPVQIALALTLSIVAAALSHELFERPVGNWVRRKLTTIWGRPQPASPQPMTVET